VGTCFLSMEILIPVTILGFANPWHTRFPCARLLDHVRISKFPVSNRNVEFLSTDFKVSTRFLLIPGQKNSTGTK
jgi:hypothetical protein